MFFKLNEIKHKNDEIINKIITTLKQFDKTFRLTQNLI